MQYWKDREKEKKKNEGAEMFELTQPLGALGRWIRMLVWLIVRGYKESSTRSPLNHFPMKGNISNVESRRGRQICRSRLRHIPSEYSERRAGFCTGLNGSLRSIQRMWLVVIFRSFHREIGVRASGKVMREVAQQKGL